MVTKFMTGLAISMGAGLVLAATTRPSRKGVFGLTTKGSMTALTRNELDPMEPQVSGNPTAELVCRYDPVEPPQTKPLQERSADLAEIRLMIDALDRRSMEMMDKVNERIDDLQNHLPRFIDVKVASRLREVEERLKAEFQDEQRLTLDAFLTTLDSKVLPRLTLAEQAIGTQNFEIGRMRERIDTTDATLNRVMNRIERAIDSMAPQYPAYANSHVTEIHKKAVA